MTGLARRAQAVLETENAREKALAARSLVKDWRAGMTKTIGHATPPRQPGRGAKPELLPPNRMPRRKISASPKNRIALLHALAHIELNAIDLACDMLARFTRNSLPKDFYDDWCGVADDEARHFLMLEDRLTELGGAYGDLPAHNGLWEAAEKTAQDLLGRLAIVPMVLEARGLDVTPGMIEQFKRAEDKKSAAILEEIYRDEIGHVAVGVRWFESECKRLNKGAAATWPLMIEQYLRGKPKPPFNEEARKAAGFPRDFYAVFE